MKRILHVFAILMLAVFAAGQAVHTAATTEMSLRMAVVAADADMNDCDGCDQTSDVATTCDQSCVQPFTALLVSEPTEIAFATISLSQSAPDDLVGSVGPPERHPPR